VPIKLTAGLVPEFPVVNQEPEVVVSVPPSSVKLYVPSGFEVSEML
jgi:hypothetical protein